MVHVFGTLVFVAIIDGESRFQIFIVLIAGAVDVEGFEFEVVNWITLRDSVSPCFYLSCGDGEEIPWTRTIAPERCTTSFHPNRNTKHRFHHQCPRGMPWKYRSRSGDERDGRSVS